MGYNRILRLPRSMRCDRSAEFLPLAILRIHYRRIYSIIHYRGEHHLLHIQAIGQKVRTAYNQKDRKAPFTKVMEPFCVIFSGGPSLDKPSKIMYNIAVEDTAVYRSAEGDLHGYIAITTEIRKKGERIFYTWDFSERIKRQEKKRLHL